MSLRANVLFWLGIAAAFGLAIYLFRDILVPFVAGAAVAYLLDPVAYRLTRIGMSRTMAGLVIVVVFIAALVILSVVLVPALIEQISAFSHYFPKYAQAIQTFAHDRIAVPIADAVGMSRSALDQRFASALSEVVTSTLDMVSSIWGSIWTGGRAVVSVLSLLVITPVVAFYLLVDWHEMVGQVDSVLPQKSADTIRQVFSDINSTVSALLRGQVSVSLILAAYYAVTFSLSGLNQGLLIGITTGLLSFIPYVGSSLGGLLAIIIALIQFWPGWVLVTVVVGICLVGQFIEGNVLQPWLIGGRIGVHPVWLMFAILACGNLLGVLGLLLAVPLAAIIGVLVRFGLRQYLASPLYSGDVGP